MTNLITYYDLHKEHSFNNKLHFWEKTTLLKEIEWKPFISIYKELLVWWLVFFYNMVYLYKDCRLISPETLTSQHIKKGTNGNVIWTHFQTQICRQEQHNHLWCDIFKVKSIFTKSNTRKATIRPWPALVTVVKFELRTNLHLYLDLDCRLTFIVIYIW